jgi:hypothetical protein
MSGLGRVIGGLSFALTDPPAFTYTGDYAQRVVQHGNDWYFEWEFRSSGTLNTPQTMTADFYLVGGGGHGGASAWHNPSQYTEPGGGGGAGSPIAIVGRSLIGACSIVIGASDGNTVINFGSPDVFTANKGLYGAPGSVQEGVGEDRVDILRGEQGNGYTGTYYGYGDNNVFWGETASGVGRTRTGANGCYILNGWSGGGTGGTVEGGVGYGAGGHGGFGGVGTYGTQGGMGTQGIVLMRVPIFR